MAASAQEPRPVNLALQGGGAHGAFTWGVLDRLFEDDRIRVAAISGTSAGAMNAVVAAQGLHTGGREGARAALEQFWRAVSEAARFSPLRRSPFDIVTGNWSLDHSPAYLFLDILNRLSSPYDLNPLNINPLRELVENAVDFDAVRHCSEMKLFISATNVETGRVRVFGRKEMTADVILASACLPFLYHAVEIDGEHYWDGGYSGNPALFPFFHETGTDDIVIVQINPILREGVPKSARDILNRVNEITFNGSLLRELRAIDFVARLIEEGRLSTEEYAHVHIHMIEARKQMRPLGASSKLNAEWDFLRHLFGIGRDAAERWLGNCFQHLGQRSTVDIRAMFDNNAPEPEN